MTQTTESPPTRRVVLAIVAFMSGLFLAVLISGAIVAGQGWELDVSATIGSEAGRAAMQLGLGVPLDDLRPPGYALALLNLPLWLGLIGVPLLDRRRGTVHNITWRALPERYGHWNSVWKRFDRLGKSGVFEDYFAMLAGLSETAHLVQMFDSTVIRAHVSAAGAKGGKRVRRLDGRGAGSVRKSI